MIEKLYVLAAAVIVSFAAGGATAWKVQNWRHDSQTLDAVRESKAQETKNISFAREEERRHVLTANKEAEDARIEITALRNALGDSDRAARRLRDALATARIASCPRATASAAGGGTTAAEAERVLANVQARYDEAARRVEQFADEAHIAGSACVRIYERTDN